MRHIKTGIVATGQDSKKRLDNRAFAFHSIFNNPKFQAWLNIQISETIQGKDKLDKRVNDSMKNENIRIDVQEDGKWVEATEKI